MKSPHTRAPELTYKAEEGDGAHVEYVLGGRGVVVERATDAYSIAHERAEPEVGQTSHQYAGETTKKRL